MNIPRIAPSLVVRACVALLCALAAPGLAGAQQQAPAPKSGGTLIAAITGDPTTLNPAATTALPSLSIAGQIHNTLLRLDNDLKPQPELAESWEIGQDGKTYTLHLRKDVKWQDGQPFTSADVQFSILEVNKKYNGSGSTAYAPVEAIDTPDPYTAVFRLKSPTPSFFPWALTDATYAQLVAKHVYEGTDPTKADANFNPVGTGPYKLKEWVKGDHITLERNPDFWKKGQPYIDRIVFKIIPDDSARVIALEKGEADYIPYYALPASSLTELEKTSGITVQNTKRPAAGEIILFFNVRNDPLKSRDVRQAIAYGLDRKAIIAKALDGRGNFATSLVPTTQGDYHTDPKQQYAPDANKANALLDQAGFKRGADGNRFSLRLSFDRTQEAGALASAAQLIREQLAPVGIGVNITPLDAAAWGDTSFIKWDFDMTMGSFGTGPEPAIGTSRLFITSNIQPVFAKNLMGYSNPQIDDLFDRGDKEMDHQKRLAIYNEAQEILNVDVPALPLWEKWYPIAYKPTVMGLPQGPLQWEPMDNVWLSDAGGSSATGNATSTNSAAIAAGAVAVVVLVAGAFVWRRRRAA